MPPPKIQILPFFRDQLQIKVYGRRVGYCGTERNMPVTWLTDSPNPHGPQCGLTDEEKREVICAVIRRVGSVRKTAVHAKYWPTDEEIAAHEV